MRDIYLTNEDGGFGDVVLENVNITINSDPLHPKAVAVQRFLVIEGEYKLLQSLKKFFLTRAIAHPLALGIYREEFSTDEIVRVLSLYNSVTQTETPNEVIDEIVSITLNGDVYEIILTTLAGNTVNLTTGV